MAMGTKEPLVGGRRGVKDAYTRVEATRTASVESGTMKLLLKHIDNRNT
jgi:hypothetical protein